MLGNIALDIPESALDPSALKAAATAYLQYLEERKPARWVDQLLAVRTELAAFPEPANAELKKRLEGTLQWIDTTVTHRWGWYTRNLPGATLLALHVDVLQTLRAEMSQVDHALACIPEDLHTKHQFWETIQDFREQTRLIWWEAILEMELKRLELTLRYMMTGEIVVRGTNGTDRFLVRLRKNLGVDDLFGFVRLPKKPTAKSRKKKRKRR